MIFWIFLIVTIVAIVGAVFAYIKTNLFSDFYDCLYYICLGVSLFCGSVFVIMGLVICCCRLDENAQLQEYQERYNMLVYQYENDFYENDNDVGKYQLLQDIRSWNEEVAKGKINQHNVWISIFVPHIYDDLDLIKIDVIDAERNDDDAKIH